MNDFYAVPARQDKGPPGQKYSTYSVLYRLMGRLLFRSKG